jgi:two-component system, chemotaxis family, sensor kinase CheA
MDNFKDTFREEAHELLVSMENDLLELEKSPGDKEILSSLFRAMHTIKGSASMFDFNEIADFTHEIESFYDRVRNGDIEVSREVINATLQARDLIREMLDSDVLPEEREEQKERVLETFRSLMDKLVQEKGDTSGFTGTEEEEDSEEEQTFRIHFLPQESIFLSGTNPVLLLKELRGMGECTIIPRLDAIEGFEGFNAESCYCSWEIIITTSAGENALHDVFIFIDSEARIEIERVESFREMIEESSSKRLGEILVDRGVIKPETLLTALANQKRLGEVLVETKLASRSDVTVALQEQEHNKRVLEKKLAVQGKGGTTIRVGSEKLDSLVDLVGELVTVQARVGQIALADSSEQLRLVAEQLERLVEELRDNTMSLRMVPIGTTFNKYRRLVRDLSLELGKDVELHTEGAETELDKTVIEKLGDPLVHLIRNSIDHGIESPESRKANGKPATGKVVLSAKHMGATVQISIEDDGAGMDRELIRKKGVEKGIFAAEKKMDEEEIFQVIFHPGFSTASRVTSVSGRGVGMDVVKRQIEELRGTVQIKSEKKKGTRITISLPLTLAIIDGLMVRVGEDYFIVPLSSVQACVELNENEHKENGKRRLIEFREKLLPYIRVDTLFSIPSDQSELRQVVVAELEQNRFGIVVDEVIGDHQTVIKNLGPLYQQVEGISGATILGDGSVALILDILQLAKISAHELR